ncbi:MAG: hypothetical protein OEQ39_28555 [Gammaproteobacteria bacterium]|nr:hypothetical protein [Gammaproteobacteria bacterium]
MFATQHCRCPDDVTCGQATGDPDRQTLARELIDDCQTLEGAAILGLTEDKIVAPDMIGIARPAHALRQRG